MKKTLILLTIIGFFAIGCTNKVQRATDKTNKREQSDFPIESNDNDSVKANESDSLSF